jgi:hypothetical protein
VPSSSGLHCWAGSMLFTDVAQPTRVRRCRLPLPRTQLDPDNWSWLNSVIFQSCRPSLAP